MWGGEKGGPELSAQWAPFPLSLHVLDTAMLQGKDHDGEGSSRLYTRSGIPIQGHEQALIPVTFNWHIRHFV